MPTQIFGSRIHITQRINGRGGGDPLMSHLFAVILTFLLQVKVALMILKSDLFYIQMTCCNLQTSFSVAVFVRYGSLLPDLEPEVHAK